MVHRPKLPGNTKRFAQLSCALRGLLVLFAAGGIAGAGLGAQSKPARNIVVLYGEGASSPTVKNAKAVIDDALRGSPDHLVLYPEYVDTIFYPDPTLLKVFEDFYTRKYKDRQPDLLIAVGPIPPAFLEDIHKNAFPGVPVVVCLMDGSSVQQLDSDFTGVEAVTAPAETLSVALRLEPNTKHVVVVGGADPLDLSRMDFVKEQLKPFASQLDISYLTDLAMPDLLGRLHHLPGDSLVLFVSLRRDGAGKPFFATESAPMVTAAANAPVFTLFDNQMGRGEVGGYVTDYSRQARAAANIALHVLQGNSPRQVPRTTGALTYMFDWQALDRWKLNERDLPPGSILMNRPPPLWNSYRAYIVGAVAVIALQALLIGTLLWNRSRRRSAEERFRAIFENSDSGITLVSMQGYFVACNPALCKMLGYSQTEMHHLTFSDITHPDDAAWNKELFSQIVAGTRDKYQVEKRHVTKDGRTIWVNVKVSTLKGPGSTPRYCIGVHDDVTERKAAENALRESEARFRSFYELPIVGCSIVIPGKPGLLANERMSAIVGYSQEELRTLSWTDITHPDDLDQSVRLYEQLLAGEIEQYTVEKRYVRKDGSSIWVDVAVGCVRNEDGSVAQICGYAQDITERKAADSAVRESEARFRSFFELPLAGCFLMSPIPAGIAGNKRLSEILGYSEEEFRHLSWRQILHPDDLDTSLQNFARLLANEIDQYSSQKRYLRRDGSIIWAELAVGCVRDENGAAVQICGLVQDITQRKLAEEALRKAEEDYRTIFEQSVSGIICVTMDGKILAVNPAAARIAGFDSPAEAMAANVNTQLLWRDQQKRRVFRDRLERGEAVRGFEFEFMRHDGTYTWLSVSGRIVAGSDGKEPYLEAFMEEITARKQLEQQLLQAQKMEAIGRLAGGVAHDFNNILGIITGYTDLILTDTDISQRVAQYVSEIRDAANRAADVTRQLLAFSRKQVLQAQVLDLNAAVREASTMVGRLIGDRAELAISLAPDTGLVEIDPTGLHRIILNLAANARDAMPTGGKLTMETSRVILDEVIEPGRHKIPAGDYAMLAISDTGTGMDAETQRHIFEPFFTTKEAVSGTGMGLATVYGIVQQSSGHILVYSEPGQGAAFKIYLPRVTAGRPAAESQPLPSIPRGNETVLLVEDNSHLRQITAKLLRKFGYVVAEAKDASEAIVIAGAQPEPPDLLVTDVIMPGMNGQELADTLGGLYPALKVLFISGYTDTVIGDRISSRGAVFLQKPFSSGDLAAKIREALAKPVSSPASTGR